MNIIMPDSAHLVFDKDAATMDPEIRHASLCADLRVDVPALKEMIDDRIIVIVGSAPFFARNGRGTPDFDFRFPGVRSLSADLHKVAFCPKSALTVFLRDAG